LSFYVSMNKMNSIFAGAWWEISVLLLLVGTFNFFPLF